MLENEKPLTSEELTEMEIITFKTVIKRLGKIAKC